jgi:type IV pilus assembly protein PilB
MDLSEVEIQAEILQKVPEEVCRRYRLIPLFAIGEEVTVAVSDPTMIEAIDMVSGLVKGPVQPVLASEPQILRAIRSQFGQSDADDGGVGRNDLLTLSRLDVDSGGRDTDIESLRRAGEETPIVKMVDKILKLAVREGRATSTWSRARST